MASDEALNRLTDSVSEVSGELRELKGEVTAELKGISRQLKKQDAHNATFYAKHAQADKERAEARGAVKGLRWLFAATAAALASVAAVIKIWTGQ